MDTSEADHWHCLGSSGPNFDPYRRELGSGRVAMPAEERPGENTLLGPLIFLKKEKNIRILREANIMCLYMSVVLYLDWTSNQQNQRQEPGNLEKKFMPRCMEEIRGKIRNR